MTKNYSVRFIATCLAVVALTSGANAWAVSVSAVGAANFYGKSVKGLDIAPATLEYSPKLAIGGGLLLEVPLSGQVALELGGLFLPRKFDGKFSIGSASNTRELTGNSIHVPLVVRVNLGPNFSFGVGGYVNQLIGSADSSSTTSPATTTTTDTQSWTDEGFRLRDYGLVGSLRLRVPFTPSVAFILDGRYALGLSEGYTDDFSSAPPAGAGTNASLKHTDIQGLVGLQFGGGGGR